MTSTRGPRHTHSQWPPAPSVEEEPQALLKELNGLSKLGNKPGVDGVQTRGAVDQYPILVSVDLPPAPSTSPISVPGVPGLGNVSSDESTGPTTPPPPEPVIRNTVRFNMAEQPKRPPPAVNQPRGPSRPLVQQQPEPNTRGPQPISRARDSKSSRQAPPMQPNLRGSRGPSALDRTGKRAPVQEKANLQPPRASLSRSSSARYARPPTRPMPEKPRRETSSGYQSDSATTYNRPPLLGSKGRVATTPAPASASGPTVAERLEEKLRRRQEQRDSGSMSDPEVREVPINTKPSKPIKSVDPVKPMKAVNPVNPVNSVKVTNSVKPVGSMKSIRSVKSISSLNPVKPIDLNPPKPSLSPPVPAQASRSSSREPQRTSSLRGQRDGASASRTPATSVTVVPTRSMSSSRHRSRPAPEVTKPATQVVTKLTPDRSPSQPAASRQASTSPQRPPPVGLGLSPCPRTIAVAGYQDWYTLKGLTHLDICPSCMRQLAHSRYRDYFIPSLTKPAGQKTRCAFANAWTRLAWAQMIKKQHDSLELLYQMTRPPPGTRSCPGRIVTEHSWHRIYDPETGSDLPGFHICSSCARNVRILMPSHRDTFQPNPDPTERVCDFVTSSPRFVRFIDLLDAAASRAESESRTRRPDMREFLGYARRKVVLRDCRRDRPTLSTWHFIPSLPELCVCEDCYDEVVWPLARAKHPIACMVTTKMRILPGDRPGRTREASCQLYSPRMRAKFREAVLRDEIGMLRSVAQRRVEAERRFVDRREELLIAEAKGYDCDEEMRKAVDEWRRWE